MTAHIKTDWPTVVNSIRALWSESGVRPSRKAVYKAVGGSYTRIEQAIDAVGIEHGYNTHLYASLPEELRALIRDPMDSSDPRPQGWGDPTIPDSVRESVEQIMAAWPQSVRTVATEAERRATDVSEHAAGEIGAMQQRLIESAQYADVTRLECAELVAHYERDLGKANASLGIAREEFAGRLRDMERAAEEAARGAQLQNVRTLEQHHEASTAAAADLAVATARALAAEAKLAGAEQLIARLTGDLDHAHANSVAAITRISDETRDLRADVAAARDAQRQAEVGYAGAAAQLAEVLAERDRLIGAKSS